MLNAGVRLANGAPVESAGVVDNRQVEVIVILGPDQTWLKGIAFNLSEVSDLVAWGQRPAALSNETPVIRATRETWAIVAPWGVTDGYASATAAHQFARANGPRTIATASADARSPLDLSGI